MPQQPSHDHEHFTEITDQEEIQEFLDELGLGQDALAGVLASLLEDVADAGISALIRPPAPPRGSDPYREALETLATVTDITAVMEGMRVLNEDYGWRALTDYLFHVCKELHRLATPKARDADGTMDVRPMLVTQTKSAHTLRMAINISSDPRASQDGMDFGRALSFGEEMIEKNVPWYEAVYQAMRHLAEADRADLADLGLLGGTFGGGLPRTTRDIERRAALVRAEHERAAWQALANAPEARTSLQRFGAAAVPIHLLLVYATQPEALARDMKAAGHVM